MISSEIKTCSFYCKHFIKGDFNPITDQIPVFCRAKIQNGGQLGANAKISEIPAQYFTGRDFKSRVNLLLVGLACKLQPILQNQVDPQDPSTW